jgi:hypothetical protein
MTPSAALKSWYDLHDEHGVGFVIYIVCGDCSVGLSSVVSVMRVRICDACRTWLPREISACDAH